MLGFGALGEYPLGGAPTGAGVVTVVTIAWYIPFSDPVRFVRTPADAIALGHQTIAFNPQPVVSFGWMEALSEPVRHKPRLPEGEQQVLAFHPAPSPFVATGWYNWLSEPVRHRPRLPEGEQQFTAFYSLPLVSFAWFAELSKPQRLDPPRLPESVQQFLAFNPRPFVSFGWYGSLSEPVRHKPRLPEGEQQYTAYLFSPNQITIGWFTPLEEPVRLPPRFRDSLRQFYTGPDRLLPPVNITGTMSALETKDIFLAGAMAWNRVVSGEVGVIPASPPGEVAVANPTIAGGSISITIISS